MGEARARRLAGDFPRRDDKSPPRWVAPPGELKMVCIHRVGGIALLKHLEKWDADPNAAWRLKIERLLPGTDEWWRTVVSGVPELRTMVGRITRDASNTNGHDPAGMFEMWSTTEHRSFTWLTDPPRTFLVGQPVEIDYVPEEKPRMAPGVIIEIRVGRSRQDLD